MAAEDDLWAAVVERYPDDALVGLTNPRKRNVGAIDTARGVAAAADIINLWFPQYVQRDYDAVHYPQHEVLAVEGVVALLWRQGGTSASVREIQWSDWVALAEAHRNVDPRAWAEPGSSSHVTEGQRVPDRRWARPSVARYNLPSTRGAPLPDQADLGP